MRVIQARGGGGGESFCRSSEFMHENSPRIESSVRVRVFINL